jgi:hypothetical protein
MILESYELLINATLVTPYPSAQLYEFVLNEELTVVECMQLQSLGSYHIMPVHDYGMRFQNTLFELNHVRINPSVDNSYIVSKLKEALENIGVEIKSTPHFNDMAQCYRPLGEIMENVRFYFNAMGQCTFLCPKAKLRLVKKEPFIFPLRY